VAGLEAQCMQHGCNMKVSHGKYLELLDGVFMKINRVKKKRKG
jgi:hypothetical protein